MSTSWVHIVNTYVYVVGTYRGYLCLRRGYISCVPMSTSWVHIVDTYVYIVGTYRGYFLVYRGYTSLVGPQVSGCVLSKIPWIIIRLYKANEIHLRLCVAFKKSNYGTSTSNYYTKHKSIESSEDTPSSSSSLFLLELLGLSAPWYIPSSSFSYSVKRNVLCFLNARKNFK